MPVEDEKEKALARGGNLEGTSHLQSSASQTGRYVKNMEPKDLTKEQWREYDFDGRVYRIEAPQALYIGTTTHRVTDAAGIVHCVPAPGERGCVLRWQPRNAAEPVQF